LKNHIEKYLPPVIGFLITLIVGFIAYTQDRIDTKIDRVFDGVVGLQIETTKATDQLTFHERLIARNGELLEEHGDQILNLNYSILKHCERTRVLFPAIKGC